MKKLLLVSAVSLFSASVHAMHTAEQTIPAPQKKEWRTTLITLDNSKHIETLSNGRITIKNIKSSTSQKPINAIIVVPASTKRSMSAIRTTPIRFLLGYK